MDKFHLTFSLKIRLFFLSVLLFSLILEQPQAGDEGEEAKESVGDALQSWTTLLKAKDPF